ncbi:MAG: hypothetical protein H7240_11705 [Glaciimonas sp.]|nr:hypothetical protein [Glaciimonas sp.]
MLIASSEKPSSVARDLQIAFDDALMNIGVTSLAIALQFNTVGQAVSTQPYLPDAAES